LAQPPPVISTVLKVHDHVLQSIMEPEPGIKPQSSNVLRKSEWLLTKIPILTYNHGSQLFLRKSKWILTHIQVLLYNHGSQNFQENPNDYWPKYQFKYITTVLQSFWKTRKSAYKTSSSLASSKFIKPSGSLRFFKMSFFVVVLK